jgi:hypothetical protein
MNNINILIEKATREVHLSKSVIGNDGENLQENLVFSFDEFVDGTARIELLKSNEEKSYIMLEKVDETYQLPIKSVLTKSGRLNLQLVITQGSDDEEIPIFKSNKFYLVINSSINAEIEEEEEYPQWIDVANTKLNEIDEALEDLQEKVDNGYFKGDKGDTGDRGQDGVNGKDAKINGVNTISLIAGDNITLNQSGNELEISATGGSGGGAVNSVNGMTGDVIINIPEIPKNVSSFTNDAGYLTEHQDLSGKQDKIDNSNKLNADLVDDSTSTNKFTNATEKATWNAKSNFSGNYEDLTNKPDLSNYQTIIDSTHKLGADLVDDSTSENTFFYIGKMSDLSTTNWLDLRKAKKGVYLPDKTYNYMIDELDSDYSTSSTIRYYELQTIFVLKEINGIATPSENLYFAYAIAFGEEDGSPLLVKFYVNTTRKIDFQSVSFADAKMIGTGGQTINGQKTFTSIPKQNNTNAPTLDSQFTNKKYVDDSISNKIWIGTQEEYDAILTKDENVLYFIREA